MALLNQSVQVTKQLEKFFETIRNGQAPKKFSRQHLKDIGFSSSNHMQFLPLLKGLGFLTSDGTPTARYMDFLDSTKWKKVLAEAVKEAYSDIFVIKAKPGQSDKQTIAGKYKSTYNVSDTVAERLASTFLTLLEMSDPATLYATSSPPEEKPAPASEFSTIPPPVIADPEPPRKATSSDVGFHYNIQIHLPATKDIEVYNAIFRSLRSHIID